MAASKRDAARVERICAWAVVALVHAGFIWVAMQWRMPADAVEDDSALAVIFIAAPSPAPAQTPEPVQPLERHDPVTAPAPHKPPPRARVANASASSPATDTTASDPPTGLTAVQIDPRTLDPARTTRAPWDAPAADLLERRAPTLPGHATQRFKMQQPRSLATAVERFGQLFGGRGEDPCKRTRANIDGLASQGDSADLQRELEYERRYCRP